MVGGINVADVPMQKGFGRSSVSLEQLLKWNPEVIIVGYDKDAQAGFFNDIYKTPEWKNIKAVKEKKVYSIPNKPFDWFDRPPSVNRIIGVKWLANLLYPQYINLDITTEVKDFYEKFYHKKLTDQEAKALLPV
ncbi:MAG: ABC transporter substrate-binding protein [Bacillota bacterium]|nr:ABC transporter substrate-binding protein [Bacillota bacterium]